MNSISSTLAPFVSHFSGPPSEEESPSEINENKYNMYDNDNYGNPSYSPKPNMYENEYTHTTPPASYNKPSGQRSYVKKQPLYPAKSHKKVSPSRNFNYPTTPRSDYSRLSNKYSTEITKNMYSYNTTPQSKYINPSTSRSNYKHPSKERNQYRRPTSASNVYPKATTPKSGYKKPTPNPNNYLNQEKPSPNYPQETSRNNYDYPSDSRKPTAGIDMYPRYPKNMYEETQYYERPPYEPEMRQYTVGHPSKNGDLRSGHEI